MEDDFFESNEDDMKDFNDMHYDEDDVLGKGTN